MRLIISRRQPIPCFEKVSPCIAHHILKIGLKVRFSNLISSTIHVHIRILSWSVEIIEQQIQVLLVVFLHDISLEKCLVFIIYLKLNFERYLLRLRYVWVGNGKSWCRLFPEVAMIGLVSKAIWHVLIGKFMGSFIWIILLIIINSQIRR